MVVDGELIGPWSASIEPLACISLWRNVKDKGMKMLIVVVVSLVFFLLLFLLFLVAWANNNHGRGGEGGAKRRRRIGRLGD